MDLPQNVDAEAQVLGAMLADDGARGRAIELLNADDFHVSRHAELFDQLVAMTLRNEPVDPITVGRNRKTDLMWLRDMAADVVNTKNVERYAALVKDSALRRRLLSTASSIAELVEQEADATELMGEAERMVMEVAGKAVSTGVPWDQAHSDALDRLEYMSQLDTPITGIATGYGVVDHRFYGLQPGQLYLVGARPSVGKTAFVLQAAIHAAKAGTKVAVFSLEMAPVELTMRAATMEAGIGVSRIRRGKLMPHEWAQITSAQESLYGLPITIFGEEADTPAEVTARCRRLKPDLVVIDYIQLLRWHRRIEKRNDELTEISRSMKLLARQLDAPVLCCAQLNRTNAGERPTLTNLRDSGALEQDADVVMFLHREDAHPTTVEVITAKNRHGATGTDKLGWDASITRFRDQYVVGIGEAPLPVAQEEGSSLTTV